MEVQKFLKTDPPWLAFSADLHAHSNTEVLRKGRGCKGCKGSDYYNQIGIFFCSKKEKGFSHFPSKIALGCKYCKDGGGV